MTTGILRRAIQEAEKSDFHQFRVASVIFKGKAILSTGTNAIRSHSKLNKKFQEWEGSVHSEQSCILNAKRNLKGTSMLVVRINKNGVLGMARPCRMCEAFIRSVGVKEVYYSTSTGEIVREKIQ